MSDFKAKMHQIRFRLGTPLGDLIALPHTPNWIKGSLLLRGGVGKGGWDERGEGRGG